MEGVMAASKKRGAAARRGPSERRTAPARGAKARGVVKKRSTRRAPKVSTPRAGYSKKYAAQERRRRAKKARVFAPEERVFHLVDTARDRDTGDMRAAEWTTCCGKRTSEVFAITLDPNMDTEGVPWCPKVVRP